jgi:hypothetical protein
MLGANIFVNE